MSIETIWEMYHKKLKHYIMKKVSDPYEVEDILQEVSLKLIKRQNGVHELENIEAWLFRVTQNAIVDYYRRKNKISYVDDLESLSTKDTFTSEPNNYNIEAASCMLKLTDYLPESYKEAIIESDYKGIKQTTLGEKWQLSHSGTKNRVQRARKKLKETLLTCCEVKSDNKGNIIELVGKKVQGEAFSCVKC
jgi:RNA polymerase sigma-70 factor (ECF subfamily)